MHNHGRPAPGGVFRDVLITSGHGSLPLAGEETHSREFLHALVVMWRDVRWERKITHTTAPIWPSGSSNLKVMHFHPVLE